MQFQVSHLRAGLAAVALLAGGATTGLTAQQQRMLDRILLLTPIPVQPGDSSYVNEMIDEARSKTQGKFRNKWNVITTEVIQDLLVSSGFPPTTIIAPDMVEQVARSLQAHAVVYGWLDRDGAAPIGRFRMLDLRRSGLSGWVTVQGQPDDPPRSFADRMADSLDAEGRAADYAKDCNARRDRSDFRGARDRADRAFRIYPNHPSAALCLSYVFEATQQPPDSLIWAYEKMTQGDSLNMDAWERLARYYQRTGDTTKAVSAFARQLAANPSDNDMRYKLAAGQVAIGDYAAAEQTLNDGIERDSANLQFVQLKVRACLSGERWECALEALGQQYALDTSVVGDPEFYRGVFGVAITLADTAAMLRWSGEAVEHLPDAIQFWQTRAQLLSDAGEKDSALFAYERLIELDSTDIRSTLTVATLLGEKFTVDSLTPLDTAAMQQITDLLTRITTMTNDDNVMTAVGGEYLKLAQKIVQAQVDFPTGISFAERALEYDRRGVLGPAANFWLGYGLFMITTPMDGEIVQSKSCAAIGPYERNLQRARQALMAGRSVSEQTVDQLLGYLNQLRERPAQFREAFCR